MLVTPGSERAKLPKSIFVRYNRLASFNLKTIGLQNHIFNIVLPTNVKTDE